VTDLSKKLLEKYLEFKPLQQPIQKA